MRRELRLCSRSTLIICFIYKAGAPCDYLNPAHHRTLSDNILQFIDVKDRSGISRGGIGLRDCVECIKASKQVFILLLYTLFCRIGSFCLLSPFFDVSEESQDMRASKVVELIFVEPHKAAHDHFRDDRPALITDAALLLNSDVLFAFGVTKQQAKVTPFFLYVQDSVNKQAG
jgi:hypothetical protein